VAPLADDEDFDEPEIPEYLIAERRRDQAGRGGARGGPRGARAAYAAAIDRERYGRGSGGGINRYPDVSGRDRGDRVDRGDRGGRGGRQGGFDRPPRHDRPARPQPRSGSSEPWSEVPPEVEAMLRAQLQSRPKPPGGEPSRSNAGSASDTSPGAVSESAAEGPARRGRRTTAARPTSGEGESTGEPVVAPAAVESTDAPARPTRRRTTAKAADTASPVDAPKRTTRRRSTSAAGEGEGEPAKPARRRTTAPDASGESPAPKRRTTRRTTTPASESPAD
jgi:hypothetical protein